MGRYKLVNRTEVSKFIHLKKKEDLLESSIKFESYTIDYDEFENFFSTFDYNNIAEYEGTPYADVTRRKALEHFISLDLLKDNLEGSTVVDIASSISPFPRIAKKYIPGIQKMYQQDISYPNGIQENKIGCDAASLPLAGSTIDAFFLHNSWEHFENFSDIGFLFEAERTLKKGGKIIIIPLDLLNRPISSTSPNFWFERIGIEPKAWPVFDPRFEVSIEEDIKQRLIKRHSFQSLAQDLAKVKNLQPTIYAIENPEKFRFQKNFLVLEKI
jgi:hypothetical protein